MSQSYLIMPSSSLLPYFGLSDFRKPIKLLKSLTAELVGTLLLVFIGCGRLVRLCNFHTLDTISSAVLEGMARRAVHSVTRLILCG